LYTVELPFTLLVASRKECDNSFVSRKNTGLARFVAELCAYLGKLKCTRYMWHELLGVENKGVSIKIGVQLRLKTSDRSI